MKFSKTLTTTAVIFAVLGCISLPATAGTITGWDLDNVHSDNYDTGDVDEDGILPDDARLDLEDGDGYSKIYDQDVSDGDVTGANTSGYIKFTPEDSTAPGIEVENGAEEGGAKSVDNCISASGGSTCNGDFQSHKRFKLDRTGLDPIDLVFNVGTTPPDPNTDNDGLYKVYQKYGNDTGVALESFTIELGFGIGGGFAPSGVDGLSFVNPDGSAPLEYSKFGTSFSAGLFGEGGDADDKHPLDGYFSNKRAGFLLGFSEDILTSNGMYGEYDDLFGGWLSYDMAPEGYFYDHDGNPDTDALLMAHFYDGNWIMNRKLLADGTVDTVNVDFGNNGTVYADVEAVKAALNGMVTGGLLDCTETPGTACLAGTESIEDLAKFNVNYSIDPTAFVGSNFTLRVTAAAVPEPGSLVLLGLGLVGLFGMKRRMS